MTRRHVGGLRAEFFFTLIWGIATLQLMGSVGWISGDRIRKGSIGTWLQRQGLHICNKSKISQIKIIPDFEIGFLFRIKSRTRTGILWIRMLWIRLCNLKSVIKLLGSRQHVIIHKEDAVSFLKSLCLKSFTCVNSTEAVVLHISSTNRQLHFFCTLD